MAAVIIMIRRRCGNGSTLQPLTISPVGHDAVAARCRPTYPPSESPTTCARPSSVRLATSSAIAAAVSAIEVQGMLLLRPWPGRSGISRCSRPARAAACRAHIQPLSPAPCSSTTAGAPRSPASATKRVTR